MKPGLVNYPLPHPLAYERYTSLTQSFTVLQVETNMLMFRIWREVGGKDFIKVLFTSDFFFGSGDFFFLSSDLQIHLILVLRQSRGLNLHSKSRHIS